MYKFQLSDAQANTSLVTASGVTSTSPQFISYVNEATRRLLRRGNWFDTEWEASFCVSGNVIAWPSWVGSVNGVRFGKSKPGQLFNNNYSFVGPHHRHSGFHSDATVIDANPGPCQNEVTGTTGKYIRYYVVNNADIGKTITIYGSQYGDQPLQQTVNGVVQMGNTIAAAAPYGTNGTLVTSIDSIVRQPTTGMAYLYEYDPVAGTIRDLASFEPNETNPRVRRSFIQNAPYNPCGPDANGIYWTTVIALVKLAYRPLVNSWDFLLIDNFDALKLMIQAIKAEESNDDQTAEIKIAKAIRELNFELREKNADDQMAVRVNAVMGRRIYNPI